MSGPLILISGKPFIVLNHRLHGSTPLMGNEVGLLEEFDFADLSLVKLKKQVVRRNISPEFVRTHGDTRKKETWLQALKASIPPPGIEARRLCFGGSSLFHLTLFLADLNRTPVGRLDLLNIEWPPTTAKRVLAGELPEEISLVEPESISGYREPWRRFYKSNQPAFDVATAQAEGYVCMLLEQALHAASTRASGLNVISAIVSFEGRRDLCEAILQRLKKSSPETRDISEQPQEQVESEPEAEVPNSEVYDIDGQTIRWNENGELVIITLTQLRALFMKGLKNAPGGVYDRTMLLNDYEAAKGYNWTDRPRPEKWFGIKQAVADDEEEETEPQRVWRRWVEPLKPKNRGWRLIQAESD